MFALDRSAVRDDERVPDRTRHLPSRVTADCQRPVRRRDGAPPHLFQSEFFPELAHMQHGARSLLQKHRERTTVLHFDARSVDGYRYARGLRARQDSSVFGTMKAADRAAEKPAFESATNREDFTQNRDRHFLGCLRAEREANRAAHSRQARRRRDGALGREAREQHLIPRA